MQMENNKVVLIGVVGMSPAVLTETVWALSRENPPVVPDEVVAITTSQGREQIVQQLFGHDSVWDSLRDALGESAAEKLRFDIEKSIRMIHGFADIASPEENEQCADFLLQQLRPYAEEEKTQIIASIAGGRKTMSALMLSCMNLLGREQDRVCHVLVNEPFEKRLKPAFYFPQPGVIHEYEDQRTQEVKKYASEDAVIALSDIPFVCVSKWQNLKYAPSSYSALVRWINTGEFDFPHIWINPHSRMLGIRESEDSETLGKLTFGLLYFWLGWMKQSPAIEGWNSFRDYLEKHLQDQPIDELDYEWAGAFEDKYFSDGNFVIDDDILRKRMGDVRKKLEALFRFPQLAKTLVPDLQKQEVFSFPLSNIEWKN
ncbi:TIGR02584 family CRISPR-associated protein [Verrucomicrobia bacterium S94]|nr:TIGR02584 family CRISPR-associated protein [Verrucomicrobia bacterium S94]